MAESHETLVRRSACVLDCPDACSIEVEVVDGRAVRVDGSDANPLTGGYICGKVRTGLLEHVYGETRVRRPAVRVGAKGEGRFESAGWDEALDRVAAALLETRERWGGEAILPFSYGGSNGLLSQDTTDARLFRRLGASRLARTVCAAPSGRAATGLYGKMAGVGLADYVHARMIVVWGANPSVSGIHLLPVLQEARRRGAFLAVVDPRRTQVARLADLHLPVRPGTDLPVALAMHRWLFESGGDDRRFLDRHTTGSEELRRRAEPWTLAAAARVADVDEAAIEELVRRYAGASPAVIRCGWGLERNRNGGSAVAAVLALPAVAGKFGVRGGGYTMSNTAVWGFDASRAAGEPEAATRRINMNRLGEVLLNGVDPPVKLLFVYNCNPQATMPAQVKVTEGLRREDLFTVVFEQVFNDTTRFADVVLPATTFLEHGELSRGYGAYVAQRFDAAIAPVGEARSNAEVFGELCRRTGVARAGEPCSSEELAAAILAGAAKAGGDGATRTLGELQAGAAVAQPAFGTGPVQFVDELPRTADGKAHLVPAELDAEAAGRGGLYHFVGDPASDRYPLALISPASKRTISSTLGQLRRELVPLRMHPSDARQRGISDGDRVRVFNEAGEVRVPARLDAELRPGVVMLPKGLWSHNTLSGGTANTLAPDTLADLGGGACFNDARVDVEPL